MVQGFNHNIKHKGKLYHIQTEDSGRDNPHIITHVFVGGNILATKKTSYADIVKAERLESIVRELMEEQHKSVLRNLINGVYDDPNSQAFKDATATSKAPVPASRPNGPTATPIAPSAHKTPMPGAVPMTNVPRPQPAQGAAPKAPAGAKEKSLDEIILSYLADRDGE